MIPDGKDGRHNCTTWVCKIVSDVGFPFPPDIIDPYYMCNGYPGDGVVPGYDPPLRPIRKGPMN